MKHSLISASLCLFASSLCAQEVTECDWRATSAGIMEPWEDYSVAFANGAVRLAQLDTIEPAAAAFHLLILSPPFDEIGARQCRIVSADAHGAGFEALDITTLEADYNPASGGLFQLPARIYDGVDGAAAMGRLTVALNHVSGEISTLYEAPQ